MLSGERDVSDILCGGAGWGRLPCTGQAVTAGFYSFTSSPYLGLSSDTGIVRMSGDQEIGDRRENRRVGLSSNKDPVLIILYNRDLKLCVRERAVARE